MNEEHMEAANRDFHNHWFETIEPHAEHFFCRKLTEDEWDLFHDLAWKSFSAGLAIKTPS